MIMDIKDMQRRLGVAQDGIIGPATLTAIYAAQGWLDDPDHSMSAQESTKKGVADFIGGFIDAHEGGLSMDPADNGNWTGGKRGKGALVGSKFGTTAGAVAAYRGVPAATITAADIASITREQAVRIGEKLYYRAPDFDRLPWNRVTLSIVDKGWGSGPAQAIKLMQRMIGVADDGKIGPVTIAAYERWLDQYGEEHGAHIWAGIRMRFDASLNQPRFLNGWNNRTKSFLPGTKWWEAWS